jgi:hypothetical protein
LVKIDYMFNNFLTLALNFTFSNYPQIDYFECKHIHNQGTQKDDLIEKRLQKIILDFITFIISWL